jgi:hypothetical protein
MAKVRKVALTKSSAVGMQQLELLWLGELRKLGCPCQSLWLTLCASLAAHQER